MSIIIGKKAWGRCIKCGKNGEGEYQSGNWPSTFPATTISIVCNECLKDKHHWEWLEKRKHPTAYGDET